MQLREIEGGSSPLARGALHARAWRAADQGIIPARAGSTLRGLSLVFLHGDHPRSRGEHRAFGARSTSILGSSPLARGARVVPPRRGLRPGIIPARAGSTSDFPRQGDELGDHPRSRGEHNGLTPAAQDAAGSSPLARGAHFRESAYDCRCGIIPARAGSTFAVGLEPFAGRDHPRSRGEHRNRFSLVIPGSGSSPLARGALFVSVIHPPSFGIIPARAGSTHQKQEHNNGSRDHPRSRGEHLVPGRVRG